MTGRLWILVAPHPDDETLGAGVSIAEHAAAGRDVRILLLTRGTNSGAIRKINATNFSPWWGVDHDPVAEGYTPLTVDEFGAARYREAVAAVGCLGVTEDRIHEASTLIGEPVLDGQVTADQVKRAIIALADQFGATNPGLWTPSHTVDDNPDHIAAGQASLQLAQQDPIRWADRRYYMLPPYWSDSRLSQVPSEFWDQPTDALIKARAVNACRSYRSWSPKTGSYAIGYHSVPDMFAVIDANPRCYIHK